MVLCCPVAAFQQSTVKPPFEYLRGFLLIPFHLRPRPGKQNIPQLVLTRFLFMEQVLERRKGRERDVGRERRREQTHSTTMVSIDQTK